MLGQSKDFFFTRMLFTICGIEGEKKEKKNPREEFIQVVCSM